MEVIGSNVGQAVDQQQNKTSHRCQTLSPNKQCVFSSLSGENTQTWVCQPLGIFPRPLSFSSFIWSKTTLGIMKLETLWVKWKFIEGKIQRARENCFSSTLWINNFLHHLPYFFFATPSLKKTNLEIQRKTIHVSLLLFFLIRELQLLFPYSVVLKLSVNKDHLGVILFWEPIPEFLVLWALGGLAISILPNSPGGWYIRAQGPQFEKHSLMGLSGFLCLSCLFCSQVLKSLVLPNWFEITPC